jgi:putative flippase GtrA
MTGRWSGSAPGHQHPARHWLGFVLSGGLSFIVDASVLKLLTAGLGIHPLLARIVSVACAIVSGWLSHRRFTFRMTTPPTLAEFLRFAGLQSTVLVCINYGIYALILVLRPGFEPLLAMIISSAVAMVFSYFGMRYAAFRHEGVRPSGSGTRGVGSGK